MRAAPFAFRVFAESCAVLLLKTACADAAVSQTDFCIGRVLDELERLGLENSTLVVAHSDHVRTLPFPSKFLCFARPTMPRTSRRMWKQGWQLGERGEWDKQTLFDVSAKTFSGFMRC